jgi:HlyD family secretion protein
MTEQQAVEKPQELLKQDQPQPEPLPNPQPAIVGADLEPKPPPAAVVGNVSEIVLQLKQERERAQKEVQTFDAAITALGSHGSNPQPLQPNPQSVPAAAQPAQIKPQPAPVAGQPPQPNPQSAPAVAQPGQAKPKSAPADAKPPHSMARRLIVPSVVILILAAVGFGVWKVFFSAPPISANIVLLSGRIEGDDSAVSPKTSGRILEIRVREGDRVSRGDIIAVLDDEQLRARVEQAQAELQQAEAKARSARDQIAVLEEQLRQEEANVAQQEAAHDIASFDKEAYTRLAKSGAVSERQGKQAVSTADQQAAAVVGAKRRVAGVNMQLAQQQAAIADAMASVGQAQAQLTEARENRQDLTVKAPFDGTVVTRVAEPGEVITSGTPVITLLDLSKVYLRGFIPEGQIGKVKLGQAAHVYLDSNPTQPVDAYVSRIDPQATFTPENTYFRDDRVKQVVGVKLQLKGALGYAKPGMPSDGEILVAGDRWPEEKRK